MKKPYKRISVGLTLLQHVLRIVTEQNLSFDQNRFVSLSNKLSVHNFKAYYHRSDLVVLVPS